MGCGRGMGDGFTSSWPLTGNPPMQLYGRVLAPDSLGWRLTEQTRKLTLTMMGDDDGVETGHLSVGVRPGAFRFSCLALPSLALPLPCVHHPQTQPRMTFRATLGAHLPLLEAHLLSFFCRFLAHGVCDRSPTLAWGSERLVRVRVRLSATK